MSATVAINDLEHALLWSSSLDSEAQAYVCRRTGNVFYIGPDGPLDEDCPDDIDDTQAYLAMPHKNDLDLGRTLVMAFIEQHAPQVLAEVADMFRRKGAYGRYKTLLQRLRLLDAWHSYEQTATRRAISTWAEDNGLVVTEPPSIA